MAMIADNRELRDRIVLISGATSGIGFATAKRRWAGDRRAGVPAPV
jgi:NADP-dependent 3-hydroxy acid dehydrogenase YdfG